MSVNNAIMIKGGDFIGRFLTLFCGYVKIICVTDGEVSERFKELVLKTSDSKRAKGSNPFLSATFHPLKK